VHADDVGVISSSFRSADVIIGDLTTQSLAAALRGLEAQQQAHQQNIANVETPGYLARRVSFEDSLRQAIDRGRPAMAGMSEGNTTDPTKIDGNNVRLDRELTAMTENALKQQLVTEALNAQYRLIRAAVSR
jgi:flagellar basal-body rod protein FlgB